MIASVRFDEMPMRNVDGPSSKHRQDLSAMTPHERLSELAAILAAGVHRLRSNPPVTPECGPVPAKSSQLDLDVSAETGPDGTVLTDRERGA